MKWRRFNSKRYELSNDIDQIVGYVKRNSYWLAPDSWSAFRKYVYDEPLGEFTNLEAAQVAVEKRVKETESRQSCKFPAPPQPPFDRSI